DIYNTSTTLMIGQTIQQVAPDYSEFYTSEWLAQTYSELVRREPILKATAAALGFEDQWRRLRGQISVSLVAGTQLMEIRVTDTDPERAKLIADEIARQLMITVEKSRPRDSYRQFVQEQVGTLPPKIQAAQAEIAELEAELSTAFSARQIQDTRSRISALEQQVGNWQATFAQYQLLLGETGVNVLTVIEEAPVPTNPVGPQWLMQVALAAAIGMVLAVGAAFLIEYLDETLRTSEDLEKATGLTTLGVISRIPGDRRPMKLVTTLEPKSQISEAYRTLRTNLRFSSPDRPLHKIMVTSPGALEGKSTMISNLAVVMAQDGKAVVLVDADLRRPMQHKIFQVENQQGLSDLLVNGEKVIDGHLQDTGIENLRLLPSGPLPPNPSELLGSQSMARLIERLEGVADIVLFDMAPVLPVTDAAVLAPQVDGILLIADAGRTRRGAARRAVENLRRVGANLLGVALNRIKLGGRSGYYYNYNYYYSSDDEGRQRKRRRRS
ncbi:MAG: polysaccharide biosynthesis tyrosine autokinase, partial [Anaerolineae bacterium]